MAKKGSTAVILNVYDLNPSNEYLYPWGLGTYHSGVQIGSDEYSFASGAGVYSSSPKQAAGAVFRESIVIGMFNGDFRDVESVVSSLRPEFPGDAYNIISKNCNCFSQALVKRLLNKDIPGYVNRLADIGNMFSCLIPPSFTNQSPVGNTNSSTRGHSDTHRLLPHPTIPFSGTGLKLSSEPVPSNDASGLSDRRERMRIAALSRIQS